MTGPLLERLGGFENLFGTGADPVVLGEVDPANGAVGGDEEFGGASDVGAVDALSGVDEVVATDDFDFRIGEEGEGESGFVRKVTRDIGRIDADGDRSDSGGVNLGELLFDTP